MFRVMIETHIIPGTDDCLSGEYTGNRYISYDEAKPELMEARADATIEFAWIEEVD